MRAITRVSIALLLGILITGGAWAQTTDQNATPNTAPGPQKMMGRRGDGQRGFDRMAQQLNLTDQQKTQMQSLMQNQRQQVQAVRNDSSLTPQQKQDKLKLLADTLLTKENLDDDEIRALLGFPARKRGDFEPSTPAAAAMAAPAGA